MNIPWNDLTIPFHDSIADDILKTWRWLVGKDKVIFIIAAIGDLFLRDEQNSIYWLSVGDGKLSLVADSVDAFKTKLRDESEVRDWFMIELIAQLKEEGKVLKAGEIYSYKRLLIQGGDYCTDNFLVENLEAHFLRTGQIHQQFIK